MSKAKKKYKISIEEVAIDERGYLNSVKGGFTFELVREGAGISSLLAPAINEIDTSSYVTVDD